MLNDQVFRTVRLPVGGGKMHKQAGFASILLILLIGFALTTLVIGMVTSVRSLQDSSLTTHAQTQAQIKSAIGYQALTSLLETLNATQIAQINNGEIKNGSTLTATYKKVTTDCPADAGGTKYFCYDITAKSGGASSVVRAIYADKTIGGGAFNGSIFAGGLQVGQKNNKTLLSGNQSILVGGGVVSAGGNGNKTYTTAEFLASTKNEDGTGGITVGNYTPSVFMTAEDVRPYANYIFLKNGTCAKNNLYTVTTSGSKNIIAETTPVACDSSVLGKEAGIIFDSGSETWTVDVAYEQKEKGKTSLIKTNIPVGVLWFEGAVVINLKDTHDLVNTIIATGDIKIDTKDGGASNKAYAPYHYYLEEGSNTDFDITRICGTSLTGIPTQYCDTTGALKTLDTEKAKIANILFLSNGDIEFSVWNGKNMSIFGNVIGSGGGGGTSSSGKFTGTGVVNVKGNLTFTGKGITDLNGNVSVTLNNSESGGSVTPSKKVFILSSFRYM